MEQLIIFLLFVVGSIISSIIQHKKKQAEARREAGEPPPVRAPGDHWPKTAGDWQEQLRRMLEGESAPPVITPVLPPATFPPKQRSPKAPEKVIEPARSEVEIRKPLPTVAPQHYRSSLLHDRVEKRMRAIRQKTSNLAPTPFDRSRPSTQSEVVQRLRRSRSAVRDAFIASVIFAAPKAVESTEIESAR